MKARRFTVRRMICGRRFVMVSFYLAVGWSREFFLSFATLILFERMAHRLIIR